MGAVCRFIIPSGKTAIREFTTKFGLCWNYFKQLGTDTTSTTKSCIFDAIMLSYVKYTDYASYYDGVASTSIACCLPTSGFSGGNATTSFPYESTTIAN